MSALDVALEATQTPTVHHGSGDDTPIHRGTVVDSRVPVRVKEKAEHPLSAALKRRAASDPEGVAGVYFEALEATKRVYLGDEWSDEPDYNVRLKAADSISNRVLGLPTAHTELSGPDGSVLTLAHLLAPNVSDLV